MAISIKEISIFECVCVNNLFNVMGLNVQTSGSLEQLQMFEASESVLVLGPNLARQPDSKRNVK